MANRRNPLPQDREAQCRDAQAGNQIEIGDPPAMAGRDQLIAKPVMDAVDRAFRPGPAFQWIHLRPTTSSRL